MTPIAWLPWCAESFLRARVEEKPVLLSIAPAWCPYSRRMDRSSFADVAIVELVNSRFVPVRVDPDRRPDISERYSLGGWPTTAFLTGEGAIIGGGTCVDSATLAGVLQRVSDAVAAGRHARAVAPPAPADACRMEALPFDRLAAQVFDGFDRVNGGFGQRPKFPHAAPLRLALELYRETGSQQYRDIAVKSLDAMGWGPLHDEEHGGFFSYSHKADWSEPNASKRLDVNASLLALYLEALETFQLSRYGDCAEDILRYTQTWLADPVDGGWAGSQADARGEQAGPPSVDQTLFSNWNAMMASAALQAGRVLGDEALSGYALRSLERVLVAAYQPGAGVAHYLQDGVPHVRGLLEDQVAMAEAALDAFEATGNVVYEMMAEELAFYVTGRLRDAGAGVLLDRVPDGECDIGLLRDRIVPFAPNCAAARMLRRVARTSGTAEFSSCADRILSAMESRAPSEGVLAAEYLLSIRPPAR